MEHSRFRAQARSLSARFREAGITQLKLAMALDVPQSQISRALSGNLVKPNLVFLELCNYAILNLDRRGKFMALEDTDLRAAIEEVWDGTVAHANALAAVIRSLSLLNPGQTKEERKR